MAYYHYDFNSSELMDIVDQAIRSHEFQMLSEQVASVVGRSVDQASQAMEAARFQAEQAAAQQQAMQQAQQMHYQAPYSPQSSIPYAQTSNGAYPQYTTAQQYTAQQQSQLSYQQPTTPYAPTQNNLPVYSKRRSQRIVGSLQSIVGFVGVATFGVLDLACLILLVESFEAIGVGLAIAFSAALAASGWLAISGIRKFNLASRFNLYLRIIGNRVACAISELQHGSGRDAKRVIKDLKQLIGKGYFPQGRLDASETTLFLTNEAYQQHALASQQAAHQAQLAAAEAQRQQQLPATCRDILTEGKQYIQFIHHANDLLPGEAISTKLDRLETIITRIFNELEKDPSVADDLKKFMNYYLPTTKKLIQTYCDLDKEPIPSDKMQQTKHEIEEALNTINQAFETLLDDLFHDTALDISSDIQVLNTMLAQEGLANNGFGVTK